VRLEFNLMIVTKFSLFQPLLKEAEVAKNANVDIGVGDHPKGVIDAEVVRIVSENTADPDGLEAAETFLGSSTDSTDQAGESEV
jgi:D-serine deaminase-like pyridoxal phosphate-dependent protein